MRHADLRFKTVQQREIDMPFGNHLTSRYSLVEAQPETGRQHQLRKHFKHIFHPILGSRPHGCNKQNKLWLEQHQLMGMMLHAYELEFKHPVTQENIYLKASLDAEFLAYNKVLGFNLDAYI